MVQWLRKTFDADAKKEREKKNCFGTYFTHAQSCDNVRVQSATDWAASVHALHMPKAVITFVFIVLRNGLLRYLENHGDLKIWLLTKTP